MPPTLPVTSQPLDVLIVGAGISGIGAAWYLHHELPRKSYAILEARDSLGGTWDLFRYPGIRSDSDLHTFGYAFRPWTEDKAIADGESIRRYIESTAQASGIDRHIRFGRRAVAASWSSEEALWTVEVEHTASGRRETITARWLFSASGYYRYDEGFTPDFPGRERFAGTIIHPQHWPPGLETEGRRVLVIGSGATAVTLVPALVDQGAQVTMLQRSPSYILPVPERDALANRLRELLGERAAYAITRRKNIARQALVYRLSRRFPTLMRRIIRRVNQRFLPPGVDVDVHFKPRYDPWDQRLCAVPDGDLYRALHSARAEIVTDRIATFTERGIQLESGRELEAEIIVTATGLNLLAFGGIELTVDEQPVSLPDTVAYKGMMLSGVPNFAYAIGYTNASWTLKVDLVCEHLTRLLAHLDARRADACMPVLPQGEMATRPLLDFQAGYVLRALDRFPRQGDREPWSLSMSYAHDVRRLRHGPVDDGNLRLFKAAAGAARPPQPALVAAA
jgi:monooxygenase